jgi:hypothetical protein
MVMRMCLATGEARLVPSRNRRKLGRSYNRLNREVDRRRAGGGRVSSSEEAE